MNKYYLPRIIPFALFMAFIGADEFVGYLAAKGAIGSVDSIFLYTYPIRIISIGILLLAMRDRFDEINISDYLNGRNSMTSVGIGALVFILWINMPWTLGVSGTPRGYNPTTVSLDSLRYLLIGFRILGASVLVPIMEELFWRSFVVRYVINPDIVKVPIGRFTWPSFIISAILFGLEHHLLFAGIMAGVAFNLLLYRTRSIAQCILAHATTNFLLGCYVLLTRQWHFW